MLFKANKWGGFALFLLWLCLSHPALAEDQSVQVSESRVGNTIALGVQLRDCTDATITITANLQNMRSSLPLPLTVDTGGRTQFIVVTFAPDNPNIVWRYTWRYTWRPGGRAKDRPKAYIYSLPYVDGTFRVLQGHLGHFSHQPGSQDEEAIDWSMPVGTTICAARPGVVVGLRQDCSQGGRDLKWKKDYNYILIRHEDGTYATYCHLKQNGVLAHLGDKVALHQPIALSGNTGYTSEPHLHFDVYNTLDGNTRQTLPLLFENRAGESVTMQEGVAY